MRFFSQSKRVQRFLISFNLLGSLSPWNPYGSSIAFVIHSLDHSLFARLLYPLS